MLSERRVEIPEGETDERTVVEAFPRPPSQSALQHDEDVLAVLRASHERMSGEVRQSSAVADLAMSRAADTDQRVAALLPRLEAAEGRVDTIRHEALSALSGHAESVRTTARDKLVATAGILSRLSDFALDRLPALMALGSAFWLWRGVLADPQPIQLAALGLYGACVIGPAIWLSSRAR
jgi:hypothetical protein